MTTTAPTLTSWVDAQVTDRFHPYPLETYRQNVLSLCEFFGLHRILEIGAGRTPLFAPDDLAGLGIEYHINDISQEELNAAPAAISDARKARFDIAGAPLPVTERYDLVYSKSVLEHVDDGLQAWRNSYELLSPGGIAFHYFPTLYCLPFVANKLLPERVAAAALERIVGYDYKKFPAKYDSCRSSHRLERAIEGMGFSSVRLVPFWGHDYFERLRPLDWLDTKLHRYAASRDWRFYSSYCYALARR